MGRIVVRRLRRTSDLIEMPTSSIVHSLSPAPCCLGSGAKHYVWQCYSCKTCKLLKYLRCNEWMECLFDLWIMLIRRLFMIRAITMLCCYIVILNEYKGKVSTGWGWVACPLSQTTIFSLTINCPQRRGWVGGCPCYKDKLQRCI